MTVRRAHLLRTKQIAMDMTHLFVPQTFARWRSQLVCASVQLGVFEALSHEPRPTEVLAQRLTADPVMLALLLRALARFGLVGETHEGFIATLAAQSLRSGDPRFLQALVVLAGPPVEHSEWCDLAEIVRHGPAAAVAGT